MLIHNADITGSLLVNGTRFNTGSFSGSFTGIVAGTTATASYVEYNSVANKPALVSGSSQITYSGLTGIPSGIVSGSSQVEYSGLTGIPSGIVSGSSQVTYSGLSGIPSGIVSGSSQVAALGFATTGSNTFQASQTITGSLFITQNLVVAGSSSIQYISSSVLDIADNIITVNAFNPGVRFGGLAVIDSGSSPQVSGSILFDSIKDQWIFVHQNQAVVTSSVLLMGPETYNDLGNESYISANRLPKGSGVEHLRDSNITDTGTVVSVNSNTAVTGSFTVVSGSAVELQVTNLGVNLGSALTDSHIISGSLRVNPNGLFVSGSGNVGIGTITPSSLLHVTDGYILIGIDKGVRFDTSGASGHPELSVDSSAALNFKNTAGSTNLTIANNGASTFSSTVTATGGYFYGQTANSFVRLDNSIGSQIGYLNYADITFDSDGHRFFTGTGTSGSRTQKFFIPSSGTATLTGTTGNRLTLYNSGNNSGLNGLLIDSDIYPGITFNSRSSASGAVIGGGKLIYNAVATGYGAASLGGALLLQADNALQFSTGGDNVRVTISSGGNLLIGTSTDAGANQPLQVIKTGSSNYLRIQTDNNASYDCGHFFTDGTNSVYAGMLRATSGLTGAHTIFTGGSSRLNVTSDGYVRLTSSSGGIQFNGDTAAANALNDYEEGSFTPSSVGTDFSSISVVFGRYIKIGNQVTINCRWDVTPGSTGMKYVVFNLPFSFANNNSVTFTGAVSNYNEGQTAGSSNVGTTVRNSSGSTTQQYVQAYYTSTNTNSTLQLSMTYFTFY